MSELHIDLLITDDDLTLGDSFAPEQLSQRDVITQDIKHTIRESGLAVLLVGERSTWQVKKILTQLELMIEQDARLVPGTVNLTRNKGSISITASTRDYSREVA